MKEAKIYHKIVGTNMRAFNRSVMYLKWASNTLERWYEFSAVRNAGYNVKGDYNVTSIIPGYYVMLEVIPNARS